MRRWMLLLALLACVCGTPVSRAAEGKVLKVFPQYLDSKGRHALSPSLFARDAYQAYLRLHPNERSGLRVAVEWKAKGSDWSHLRLRIELRSVHVNQLTNETVEMPAVKTGWLRNWSETRITGANYKDFGELAAWRVSLWDGDRELSSQESFLWSGVTAGR